MHLKRITINNYRTYNNIEIDLTEGLNVIVGSNNAGKSNLLNVIRYLSVDPNNTKSIEDINKYFLIYNLQSLKDKPPVIEIKYEISHSMKYEVPDSALIKLQPFIVYSDDGQLTMGKENTYKINAEILLRYELDANKTNEYRNKIHDEDNLNYEKYFNILKQFEGYYKWSYYNNQSNEIIECKNVRAIFEVDYIEASRDISELETTTKKYINEKLEDENNIEDLKVKINCDIKNQFSGLTKKINKEIEVDQDLIGVKDGKNDIVSTFEFNDEFSRYYKYELQDSDEGFMLPINYNGLGFNNLIHIRNLIKQKKDNDYNILLIEEPEAHLHPSMQYKLLQYINGLKLRKMSENSFIMNQIIITTHSPNITAATNMMDMLIMTNYREKGQMIKNTCIRASDNFDAGSIYSFLGKEIPIAINKKDMPKLEKKAIKQLNDLNYELHKDLKHLAKFLDVTRSELLFSSKVILVEGIAEKLLMTKLAKSCDPLINIIDEHVVVIEVAGINFNHFLPLMIQNQKKILCITDCDFKYYSYNSSKKTDYMNDLTKYKDVRSEKLSSVIRSIYSECHDLVKVCTQEKYGSTFETELFLENYSNVNTIKQFYEYVVPDKMNEYIKKSEEMSIEDWKKDISTYTDGRNTDLINKYLNIFYDQFTKEEDKEKKNNIEKIFFASIFYYYVENKKGNFALKLACDDNVDIIVPKYIEEGLKWMFQK